MKQFEVLVTQDAEKDLEGIYQYITRQSGVEQANIIEDRLIEAILSLEKTPERGRLVPEMLRFGIAEYREVQASPWRIIYTVTQVSVGVVAIIDSRRNAAELMQRRLML